MTHRVTAFSVSGPGSDAHDVRVNKLFCNAFFCQNEEHFRENLIITKHEYVVDKKIA